MAANIVGKPSKILSVILGASQFDGLPTVESEEIRSAFRQSKLDFAKYAAGISSQVLDKFDSNDLPNELCLEIGRFLKSAKSATDLIVYYVGHGGFLLDAVGTSEYFLALRTTTDADKYVTGLRVGDLAQAINRNAANLRAIVILDCCYAGEAVRYFTGGDPVADRSSQIPFGVTLFTASPSKQEAIVPPGEERTMFSGCLLDVLSSGISDRGPLLSIREVSEQVRLLIEQRYPDDGVRPEVHSPRQRFGDVADYPFFLNNAHQSGRGVRKADVNQKVPSPSTPSLQDASLAFFLADAGLSGLSGIAVLVCTVIEDPDSVRQAIENVKRRLIADTFLALGAEVRDRLRKVGFDYFADDSDVRAKLIQTIATLTYEAYSCAGGRAYFGKASQERVFCELFARLIFDRMRKHKSKRIEIFLGNERAGLRDALQGVVSSCVHSINASHRGQVGFPPVIHTIKRGDGCLELTRYVAAVVRQQLERGEFEPAERRDYRRIESKVRLIRRLETDEFFSRRHPLPD